MISLYHIGSVPYRGFCSTLFCRNRGSIFSGLLYIPLDIAGSSRALCRAIFPTFPASMFLLLMSTIR